MTDEWPAGWYVVVSGPPGSGKTALATALAPALGLPLIAKDTIKEALMTVLPVPDVPASRTIGRASVAALLAVAAVAGGWPVIEVDTTGPVDLGPLIAEIRAAAGAPCAGPSR